MTGLHVEQTMRNLIDTHCHLNDEVFVERVEQVIAAAATAGIRTIIVPGWDRESSVRALALADEYPAIRPAVGLHPWFVAKDGPCDWLPDLLADPRVVALGEIGLDGAENADDTAGQEAAFRLQLALAAERNLPILIHCRRGWDRLLRELKGYPGLRGIIHAYSGSREILRDCLHLGYYISFAGMVTRPHSFRAQEAAKLVPADRLLLETDAPCMTLEGVAPGKSEPAHLAQVLHFVAALRETTPEALAEQVERNVTALFGEGY